MGSDELLEFEAWGESDVGLCWPEGVTVPWGDEDEFPDELLRFDEPTRFLKRAFMEFISWRGEAERLRVGCCQVNWNCCCG
jgi:hypothetical protein